MSYIFLSVTLYCTYIINLRIIKYENNQQDARYRLIYYSKSALHVSGDVSVHHQEHWTVFTVSGSVETANCVASKSSLIM
jgi:hypothetical protein